MKGTLRSTARSVFNLLLSPIGLKLVRHDWSDPKEFLPLQETLVGAKESGLSVGDYVDAKHSRPGATQETIDHMIALGVFTSKIERVCEIGPGSGRYLDKTLQVCSPAYYEIYETASDWAKWLAETYEVISQPTDGNSLASTPSCSIDLIHAHKVFVITPFLTTCRYFAEMARVVRDNGKVVFDIVTEGCLDDATLEKWFAYESGYTYYPCITPKQYTIDLFSGRGFSFNGSFFISLKPGITEYLVFTKTRSI